VLVIVHVCLVFLLRLHLFRLRFTFIPVCACVHVPDMFDGWLKYCSTEFKVACVQISVTADKSKNLTTAAAAVATAAATGAKIIVLPEMFNCPYSNTSFPTYAESVPLSLTDATEHQPTARALSAMAAQHRIYLVGGVALQCFCLFIVVVAVVIVADVFLFGCVGIFTMT
jgi:hypothetical protein